MRGTGQSRGPTLAWGVLAVFLAIGGAHAAPFLQYGVDAARTGASADPGPVSIEVVAFNTTIDEGRPAQIPWGAFPVIQDGAVYALQGVNPPDNLDGNTEIEGPGPAFIERIDLATAERSVLVPLGESVLTSGFVSDGTRLFVVVGNEVHAFDVASGAAAWSSSYVIPALSAGEPGYTRCNAPAVAEGLLVLPCHQVPGPDPGAVQWLTMSRPAVIALDATTGAERWLWAPEPSGAEGAMDGGAEAHVLNYSPGRLTIGDGRVYFTIRGAPATAASFSVEERARAGVGVLQALDLATGRPLWQRTLGGFLPASADELGRSGAEPRKTTQSAPGPPAILHTPDALYVKLLNLEALDPATGAELWSLRLVPEDDRLQTGHALALHGDRLLATAFSTLYGIDVRTHAVVWERRLPDGEHWGGTEGMVLAGGRAFAITNAGRVFAFAMDDGRILEQRILGARTELRFGVGEGVLAALLGDGRVMVLGATPAAIDLRADLDEAFPAPGATVTLDLGGTRAGVLARSTEFRVDWGDGALSTWTTETGFTHAYATPGERTVRVLARNAAGQEAAESLAVHVGGTPPARLNAMQTAFAPENQERTFFVLGLVITLLLAVLGALRLRRRRSLLQRELAAIATAFERAKANPLEAEAALAERRAHVRGLLADGRIDAAEAGILEHRIDELGTSARVEAIDERFGFLPVGMARTLREMLADGRIQRWERDHFLAALGNDGYLTKAQKALVKRQIEEWFREDAARVGRG